jgi:hypothetical protein
MDPIIASGLFTVGKAFVERMTPLSPLSSQISSQISSNISPIGSLTTGKIDFSNVLNSTIQSISSPSSNTSSITSSQLSSLQSQLKSQYGNFLDLKEIPSSFRPQSKGDMVTVSLEKGDKIFITNQAGQKMELSKGGESYQLAENLFQLKNQINQHKGVVKTSSLHMTGATIY